MVLRAKCWDMQLETGRDSPFNIIVCVIFGFETCGSDFRLYDGSDLKTYLLMRW